MLIIAPHPDDEILGCGGLISKIKESNGKVYVLFLTNGTTKDFTAKGVSTLVEREKEINKVAAFLGYDGFRIAFPGNDYHLKLDGVGQKKIIHEIERGRDISLESVKPDILVFPFYGDYNQDHAAAAKAAFSACRPTPKSDKFTPDVILSYEEATDQWSLNLSNLNFFVKLSEGQVDKKMTALSLYESQLRGKGHPRNLEIIKHLSALRGSNIGEEFAEGFYCQRLKI